MKTNNKFSEKELDKAIENAFISDEKFVTWFLNKTKFGYREGKYLWSRSDHPWGKVKVIFGNDKDGIPITHEKESETDVLVVFEIESGLRVALHIENKLSGGHFTELQPELYNARGEHWLNVDKYKNYVEFETVLIAPLKFYKKNFSNSIKFDRYISHEELSLFIPEFGVDSLWATS